MSRFTTEKLPSGVICEKVGAEYLLIDTDGERVILSISDIDRLQGIIHPTKIYGKWKGHCGEGPEHMSEFEKAIEYCAEDAIINKNYSPDTL